MSYFDSLEHATGIVDVFLERPNKYAVALTLAQELLREPSHLSPLDRELIATYTSYLNQCDYCYGSHKEFCLSLGATEEDLAFSESHRLAPLLHYVKALTLNPSSVHRDLKLAVMEKFSEEELKDAIAVCSAFNFYNRIVAGHGIEANAETWKTASESIQTHGYDRRYL